ncbi:MAG: hypothetical protein QXP31_05875 [Pyrobaculum sp.]
MYQYDIRVLFDRLTFESVDIDVLKALGSPIFSPWIGAERLEFGARYNVEAVVYRSNYQPRKVDEIAYYILWQRSRFKLGHSTWNSIVARVMSQAPEMFATPAVAECHTEDPEQLDKNLVDDLRKVIKNPKISTRKLPIKEYLKYIRNKSLAEEFTKEQLIQLADKVVDLLESYGCRIFDISTEVYENRCQIAGLPKEFKTVREIRRQGYVRGELVVYSCGICALHTEQFTVVDYCDKFSYNLRFRLV